MLLFMTSTCEIDEHMACELIQNYMCYCQPCMSLPPPPPPHAAKTKSAIAKFGAVAFASIVIITVLLAATVAAVAYKMSQDSKLTMVSHMCSIVNVGIIDTEYSNHVECIVHKFSKVPAHSMQSKACITWKRSLICIVCKVIDTVCKVNICPCATSKKQHSQGSGIVSS